jgi:nicotinic acetylcholine receptor
MMRRPEPYRSQKFNRKKRIQTSKRNGNSSLSKHYPVGEFIEMTDKQVYHHPLCHQKRTKSTDFTEKINSLLSSEAMRAVEAVDYITEYLKRLNKFKKIKEEWNFVGMVIDRLLLYVFFAITVGGSMGILLSAPNVFEYVNQTLVIERLMKSAEAELLS